MPRDPTSSPPDANPQQPSIGSGGSAPDPGKPMPNLDSQPLWIKVAALIVAVGGILALVVLYAVRL